ncbi:hypothetical protein CSV86_011345 [Pseudomonas putida CSV86]|uniref:Uncharacterized protein n=1 Tax=Pseudomonas bharatica CSV86 TaxID=1005395 RepID=L1LUT2_9PSED|nr:hypothetical protein [Pseudomonas bharatica]NNJ15787.1 hypothetical protein [Pseudomonas bharatica CSV86]
MTHDDSRQSDKTPQPLSSENAQKGATSPGPVLQQPDPRTEAVDKIITPVSIKEKQDEAREIEDRLTEVEKRGRS